MGAVLNGYAVLDRLTLISGIDKEAAVQYLPSCSYELQHILSRLKKGINADDFADGIINAAAAQVNLSVVSAGIFKGDVDFTIGDVSVKRGNVDRLAAAEKLRFNAFAAIAHILTDESFAFIGTGS